MERMTPIDRQALITAIARREGTAKQLAQWYGLTVEELREFLATNRQAIEREAERATEEAVSPLDVVTPTQLEELWISNKFQRLVRYQEAADLLFKDIRQGSLVGAELATSLREFRSYLTVVANELGQLLHRGSGDGGTGDSLNIDIQGVDMDSLR